MVSGNYGRKWARTLAAYSAVSCQRVYGTDCQPWFLSHCRMVLSETPSSSANCFGVTTSDMTPTLAIRGMSV